MKVQGPGRPPPPTSTRAIRDSSEPQAPSKLQASRPAARRDKIELSERAALLAAAKAPETPDMSRVEKLKKAIADGSYSPDSEKIADALLKEER